MNHPISSIQIMFLGGRLDQGRPMTVAEDHQIQVRLSPQTLQGPGLQEAGRSSLRGQRGGGPVAGFAYPPGYPGSEIRMEPAEGPTGETPPEDRAKDAVAGVALSESVPMSDEGPPTVQLQDHRFPAEEKAELLFQKAPTPPVMVPAEEHDRDAPVYKTCQGSQGPQVPAGDDAPVLEPEIEQVTQEDDLPCLGARMLQPSQEGPLGLRGDCPEVYVTGEVDGFGFHGDES